MPSPLPWLWLALLVVLSPVPRAQAEEVPDEAPPRAKVAVVVSGDPDDGARAAAAAVEAALVSRPSLYLPTDELVRGALRGELARDEDGLDGLRSLRRSLGLDEEKDEATLTRIAESTGADALVVVRRRGARFELMVFDRVAARFYEGTRTLEGTPSDGDLRYVERRALRAAQRVSEPPSAPATVEPSPSGSPDASRPRPAPALEERPPARDAPAEKRTFWQRAWPYLVAGALLAGTVTFFVVRGRPDDPPPPVLRWSQGGNP